MDFKFKQFSIAQDRTAMKVGTDGVLLGAWTPIPDHTRSILDIGTGTGLIALMLAQRSNAEQIDAIEIEENAYEQAVENFENSPWSDRLFCYHAGLDEFMEEPEDEYDLIVSNPPFYIEDQYSGDENRNLARFEKSLPFEDLIEAADLLLSENGILSVIIPFAIEIYFLDMAKAMDLFPLKITRVRGTKTSAIIRSLLAFTRFETPTETDELIIENSRHVYTSKYIELTKEFYLKM